MALLEYSIAVVGAKNVDQALASMEARMRLHNSRVTQMYGTTPAQARRASSPGGIVAEHRSGAAAAARGIGQEARQRLAAEKQIVREKAKAQREEYRLRNQVNALNLREQRKELRERERASVKESRVLERRANERSRFAQATLGHGAERVMDTVRAVGRIGATVLGVGGAAMAAGAVGQASRLDEQTRRMIINARGAGETSKYTPEGLRKQITQTGIETGIDPEQVASGAAKFVSVTGNIGGAVDRMKALATFAQATGSTMEDLAGIAGSLFNNGVTSVDDMTKALSTMVFQGKKASFELKDMAQFMPAILAKGSTMGLGGVEGAGKLGGFLQIAMAGTQNAAEAATATERMLDALVMNADKMASGEAFGNGRKVDVYTDKSHTKMRDATKLLPEILGATGGDIGKTFSLMDVRGSRATNKMLAAYNDAAGATKGTPAEKRAAGVKAVSGMISEFANVKGDYAEIQKDANEAMKSFSVQMEILNTRIKDAIASELMPELIKLAPELSKLIPYVSKATSLFIDLVSFLANHPFASIATVLSAQILADVMAAKIGATIAAGVQGSIGAASKLGSALTIAATAVTVTTAGIAIIDKLGAGANAADKKVQESLLAAGNASSALRFGENTPEARKKAAEELQRLGSEITLGEKSKADKATQLLPGDAYVAGVLSGAAHYATGGAIGAPLGVTETGNASAEHLDAIKAMYAQVQADLAAAIIKAGGDAGAAAAAKISSGSSAGAPPNRSNAPSSATGT